VAQRCVHPHPQVLEWKPAKFIHMFCHLCKQGWHGLPYGWTSRQGKAHRPPGWVRRVVEEVEKIGMDAWNARCDKEGR
jgi:hypothetical protein